jgi:hypothetical protein
MTGIHFSKEVAENRRVLRKRRCSSSVTHILAPLGNENQGSF